MQTTASFLLIALLAPIIHGFIIPCRPAPQQQSRSALPVAYDSNLSPLSAVRYLQDFSVHPLIGCNFRRERYESPIRVMDQILSEMTQINDMGDEQISKLPVDIREHAGFLEIIADAPGASIRDAKITIKDHVLSITTERKRDNDESAGGEKADTDPDAAVARKQGKEPTRVFRSERRFGASSRSLQLPEGLDLDEANAEATFVDGVLTVKIPKLAPEAKSERVKVIRIK